MSCFATRLWRKPLVGYRYTLLCKNHILKLQHSYTARNVTNSWPESTLQSSCVWGFRLFNGWCQGTVLRYQLQINTRPPPSFLSFVGAREEPGNIASLFLLERTCICLTVCEYNQVLYSDSDDVRWTPSGTLLLAGSSKLSQHTVEPWTFIKPDLQNGVYYDAYHDEPNIPDSSEVPQCAVGTN